MAPRWRVLLTDRAWPDWNIETEILSAAGVDVVIPTASDPVTLAQFARDVDAIGTNWAKVTREVIEACPRCRIVSRFGIGLDNIDVAYASQRGIPVTNVPDYCVQEVADHTLAMLLGAARNIAYYHLRMKSGQYFSPQAPAMHRLQGSTLGLIGLGRIGHAVAERARGFGLRILGYTSSGSNHGVDCQMVSLPELLQHSDYISLHAPLTEKTRHLLGREQIGLMKPTVWIINTSRGGLIDNDALWEALQNSRIAGAALDVFTPEPPDLTLPLYRDERVILSPHAAFVSVQSVTELRQRVARQLADALQGHTPENGIG